MSEITEAQIRGMIADHQRAHGIAPTEVRPTPRRSELMIDGRGVLYVPRIVLYELTGTLEPTTFLDLPVVELAIGGDDA